MAMASARRHSLCYTARIGNWDEVLGCTLPGAEGLEVQKIRKPTEVCSPNILNFLSCLHSEPLAQLSRGKALGLTANGRQALGNWNCTVGYFSRLGPLLGSLS